MNNNEKWFGEKCEYQICQFETDCAGNEYKSEPIFIYCTNKYNYEDCEGNCYEDNCPLLRDKEF